MKTQTQNNKALSKKMIYSKTIKEKAKILIEKYCLKDQLLFKI
jgi:hypothetical protein